MKENIFVMGWVDPYTTYFEKAEYDNERKNALVTRIKKRRYWFTHFDHEFMGITPIYSDNKYCLLTKAQLDEVFSEAYKDIDVDCRKIPLDEEECVMYNGVLFEKQKYLDKYKESKI